MLRDVRQVVTKVSGFQVQQEKNGPQDLKKSAIHPLQDQKIPPFFKSFLLEKQVNKSYIACHKIVLFRLKGAIKIAQFVKTM